MTPPLDYRSPEPKRKAFRFLPVGLAVLFVLVVLSSILIPSGGRPRGAANRVKSASNLRQIGQAILMYSNENAGAYPPDLPTLLVTEDLPAEVFVSPSSNDARAVGPTTRAIAEQLLTPHHCSYTYLGNGLKSKSLPDAAVVAYEVPSDTNSGGNVLFGNGHVECLDVKWFTQFTRTLATRPSASTQPIVLTPS